MQIDKALINDRVRFFLTVISLPQGQLWAILKGTASPDTEHSVFMFFSAFLIGSPSPAERWLGFDPETFRF